MPDLLEEGCLLFNARQFFEAHEVWEDLWRATPASGLKTCYQGFIQAAVGMHHLSRENLAGARSQLTKSIRNLESAGLWPEHLDVAGLIEQLSSVLRELPQKTASKVAIRRLK